MKLGIRKFCLNIETNFLTVKSIIQSFLGSHYFHIYFTLTAPQVILTSRPKHFMEFDFKHK